MKFLRWRSYSYVVAMLLVALLLGWAGRVTWQELRQLHRSFDSIQREAFQLSDHITAAVGDLNHLVQNFNQYGAPEDRVAFQMRSERLRQWIHTHLPNVTTTRERELIGQIDSKLEVYLTTAQRFVDPRAQARATLSPAFGREQLDDQAASILALSEKLQAGEYAAEAQFMDDSRSALAWLQELLSVQMGLLFMLIASAVVAIYRGVIGPLRVELEESRGRAARQEKLASLGTLAAGVAHEIRNPLTAINVRIHGLKKKFPPQSSEYEDVLVISHEIQRLEGIVQGVLRFARPADPKLVTISADSLLTRIQSLFSPQFDKTALRLKLESVPDLWVRVDPGQIEQVLINLIQNAAESMVKGGAITLRARDGSARLGGNLRPTILLEVSDTGAGLSPEIRKRIFDPFFTTKEAGTGLGLAIAARIVEKQGGALECHSELNHGTTFVILLPQAKPETFYESPGQNIID